MSLSPEASWAPTLDEATLRGRVKQWREDDKRRADVLLLRARPSWAGAETLSVGDEQLFDEKKEKRERENFTKKEME